MGGHKGYLHIGLYPDTRRPGEVFIKMAKEGSTLSGVMDAFATNMSIALQYGVPLAHLCDKMRHMRFEPQGFTSHPDIPSADLGDGLHRPVPGAAVGGGRGRVHGAVSPAPMTRRPFHTHSNGTAPRGLSDLCVTMALEHHRPLGSGAVQLVERAASGDAAAQHDLGDRYRRGEDGVYRRAHG